MEHAAPAAPLITGLLAGGVHVLAGPDHLAAVAPFALRRRWSAWISGMQWGLGHTLGVGVIALIAWLLRGALPLERISGWSEQIVGIVLVAIGLWTIRAAIRQRVHIHEHEHEHDGIEHAHIHVHEPAHGHDAPHAHEHSHAPIWVGVLHGTAGSAHFLAILPALAFRTSAESAAYLIGYAGGTIVAMVAFTAVLGSIAARMGGRTEHVHRRLLASAGIAAVVVGGFWLFP